jgi:hypothetical protein
MKRPRRWIISSVNGAPDAVKCSDNVCDLPCIARLLQRKGLSNDEQAADFLRPRLRRLSDPFLLPNMRPAVDRILCAITDRQRIVLWPSHDGREPCAEIHVSSIARHRRSFREHASAASVPGETFPPTR